MTDRISRSAWLTGLALLAVGVLLAITVLSVAMGASADGGSTKLAVVPVQPFDPARAPSVRLAAAGDVGTGDEHELRTAMAMDALERERPFDALLLLGDNIYPAGDPSKVEEVILEPFAGVLDGGTALLPVLGNHDAAGPDDGDQQVAALGMPGRWYSTRIGDLEVVSLDSNRADDPEQARWLRQTLVDSTATWTIATMHHPPYSGGVHGSSVDVRAAFSPLFEQYGVDLVLAGHDHDYQRMVPQNGVTYIVSGAGAKLRPASLADFSVVATSTLHFLDIAVFDDEMVVRAVNQDGMVFDEVTLMP